MTESVNLVSEKGGVVILQNRLLANVIKPPDFTKPFFFGVELGCFDVADVRGSGGVLSGLFPITLGLWHGLGLVWFGDMDQRIIVFYGEDEQFVGLLQFLALCFLSLVLFHPLKNLDFLLFFDFFLSFFPNFGQFIDTIKYAIIDLTKPLNDGPLPFGLLLIEFIDQLGSSDPCFMVIRDANKLANLILLGLAIIRSFQIANFVIDIG